MIRDELCLCVKNDYIFTRMFSGEARVFPGKQSSISTVSLTCGEIM